MKGRIAKFKINPGKYNPYKPSFKHYWMVHVFDNKDNLQAAGYKLTENEKEKTNDFLGLVAPKWREKYKNGEWVKCAKIGDILFYKDYLNANVISHESVHAATSFLRILNKLKLDADEIDDNEEMLAYTIGSICNQISIGLTEANLI